MFCRCVCVLGVSEQAYVRVSVRVVEHVNVSVSTHDGFPYPPITRKHV